MANKTILICILFFISCKENKPSSLDVALDNYEKSLQRHDSILKYHYEVLRCNDKFMDAYTKWVETKDEKYIKEEMRWHDSTIKYSDIQKSFAK